MKFLNQAWEVRQSMLLQWLQWLQWLQGLWLGLCVCAAALGLWRCVCAQLP
jgi:hypothetical protein